MLELYFFRDVSNYEELKKKTYNAYRIKSYSYLPEEAKEYIKEKYEETGEVILTEKNKEKNKLYLNPQYVKYLTYSEEEKDKFGRV